MTCEEGEEEGRGEEQKGEKREAYVSSYNNMHCFSNHPEEGLVAIRLVDGLL